MWGMQSAECIKLAHFETLSSPAATAECDARENRSLSIGSLPAPVSSLRFCIQPWEVRSGKFYERKRPFWREKRDEGDERAQENER